MKIQMLKDVIVEVERPFRGMIDTQLHKWDELSVDRVINYGSFADLILENGETLLWVPVASFSQG
jgi:arsenate reductase-like glutaredoxin family protein